jgi:hypothetical protein
MGRIWDVDGFMDEVLAEIACGQGNRRDPTCSKRRKGVAQAARASPAHSPKLAAVALANTNAAIQNDQPYQQVA